MPESRPTAPSRRLLVSVDMQKYSRQDNLQQFHSQQKFQQVITEAVQAVGLDRKTWVTQQGGDSELAIMPAETPEPLIIGRLAPEIDEMLREYNRHLLPLARVRLRMAVHEGLTHLDGANGYPGDAVVTVSRLRDARPLKLALAAFPEAGLGLIVSDSIYRDVVSQRYEGIRSERFRRVTVNDPEKQFTSSAWISVLGEDVTGIDLGTGPASGPEPTGVSRESDGVPRADQGQASKYGFGAVQGNGSVAIGDNAQAHTSPGRERR